MTLEDNFLLGRFLYISPIHQGEQSRWHEQTSRAIGISLFVEERGKEDGKVRSSESGSGNVVKMYHTPNPEFHPLCPLQGRKEGNGRPETHL
jgi:hypothetical protein